MKFINRIRFTIDKTPKVKEFILAHYSCSIHYYDNFYVISDIYITRDSFYNKICTFPVLKVGGQ